MRKRKKRVSPEDAPPAKAAKKAAAQLQEAAAQQAKEAAAQQAKEAKELKAAAAKEAAHDRKQAKAALLEKDCIPGYK